MVFIDIQGLCPAELPFCWRTPAETFGEAPGDVLMAALYYVVVPGTEDEFLVLLRAAGTCR